MDFAGFDMPGMSREGARRYYVISCHVLWRELCYYAAISRNIFMFHFLKQGLHNEPDLLRQRVQHAIDAVEDGYHAILLGYGLCSNGVVGLVARKTPLVIMRGHDCITFLLGSKERYRKYFDEHPGTYWYSPGWIDTCLMPGPQRHHQARQTYIEKYGEENAEFLVNAEQAWVERYSNAAYVDLGFYDTSWQKQFTRRCAEFLGWKHDILTGSPDLIINFLEGRWDPENFLLVQPGETVVASHDEGILAAKPVE